MVDESRARARTRRVILDAAVSVLARQPGASLGEVAAAAGVGRTTMHRYFAERSDLMAAIGQDLTEKLAAATDRARLTDGAPAEALNRLCQEYFELGDGLLLLFEAARDLIDDSTESEADQAMARLIHRGLDDGSFDPELSADWIEQTVWALLYGAWVQIRAGAMPRHTALDRCLRTIRKAVAA